MSAQIISLSARRAEPEERRLTLLCIQAEIEAGLETGQFALALQNIRETLASFDKTR